MNLSYQPRPSTPQEVAGRIAALHNATPKRTPVIELIGSTDVAAFIAEMEEARASAKKLEIALD